MADILEFSAGNNVSDTLSNTVGAGDSTLPVNNISVWPNKTFSVIIDRGLTNQEIVACSGTSGLSLVVSARGQEQTTASLHNSGATVESVPLAGKWNDLIDAVSNVLVKSTGLLDTTKVADLTTAQTLTNKTRVLRDGTTTSSANPAINTDLVDVYRLTAQAVDIVSFTTNLTGTPTTNQTLLIEITGTGARNITWGSSFESSTVSLPSVTVGTNMLQVLLKWNSSSNKWRCIGVA